MILTSDFWESVINDERVEAFPDWEAIDRAISRLDEKIYTLVTLDDEKRSNLLIGGGPSGMVIAFSNQSEHLIAREGDDPKTISIVVGGQAGDYRRRNVFCLEKAKDIAKRYFEGADVQALGHWEGG